MTGVEEIIDANQVDSKIGKIEYDSSKNTIKASCKIHPTFRNSKYSENRRESWVKKWTKRASDKGIEHHSLSPYHFVLFTAKIPKNEKEIEPCVQNISKLLTDYYESVQRYETKYVEPFLRKIDEDIDDIIDP
jgi:hypothetical protein